MNGMEGGYKESNFLKDFPKPHMFGQVLTRESLNDDMRVSKDIKVCDVHELGLR